jgi:hypothetical protein
MGRINYNLNMEKVIEVNLGIGMNQLFPETTKIVIEVEDEEEIIEVFPVDEDQINEE